MATMVPRRGRRAAVMVAALGSVALVSTAVAFRHVLHERWLIRKLDSGDMVERLRAARELGRLRSEKATPSLIRLLEESEGKDREASQASGMEGLTSWNLLGMSFAGIGRPATPHLVDLLDEKKRYLRRASAACLVLFGKEARDAAPSLIPLLQDKEREVRFTAVLALGALGNPEVVPALRQVAQDEEENVMVREFARRSLKDLEGE